jgi:hypothetical protein
LVDLKSTGKIIEISEVFNEDYSTSYRVTMLCEKRPDLRLGDAEVVQGD